MKVFHTMREHTKAHPLPQDCDGVFAEKYWEEDELKWRSCFWNMEKH